MITKVGIGTLLAGLCLGLFTGISSFMAVKNKLVGLTVSKIIGEDKSEAIITFLDVDMIQNILDSVIYELPFFVFLIGLGIIILAVSLFVKDH